jgi:hypothetical protein
MKRVLLALSLVACGPSEPPVPRTALGTYDIDGPATCTVSPDGAPDELFTVTGEVELAAPPAGHPASCERILDLRIETCPTCPASPCRLCLNMVSDVEGVMNASVLGDPTLLGISPACQLQDSSGSMTTSLFVDGRAASGSAAVAEDGTGALSLTLEGTSARGISGDNRPSTTRCELDLVVRPDAP